MLERLTEVIKGIMTEDIKQLIGAKIISGPQPWQVIQRGPDGLAVVTLTGTLITDTPAYVEVRVASETDGSSVPGCDWQNAEMLSDVDWQITLNIPTGALYSIQTRLRKIGFEWRFAGDKIQHIAVGDVWVIAGQSNAVGYGHGIVTDPPAFGVHMFGLNEVWRLATHPIFDSMDAKHPANYDDGWVDVSPWLAFGKEVMERAGVPVGLIPAALGGSPLRAWDPGSGEAFLYDNMVELIEAAGGSVAGMVWYQGCTDADSNDDEIAGSYLTRFTRFVDAFRSRYGTNLPIITAQLNRVMYYPEESNKYWSIVREAQRQAPKAIPNVAVVPTADLSLSDGIHTSAIGNVTLGRRFGLTALGMVYGKDVTWKPMDMRKMRFLDGERKSIRMSFDNVLVRLYLYPVQLRDFTIEDEKGSITVKASRMDGNDAIVLDLERPAEGKTICHNMFGCDPVSTVRDEFQRPILAFSAEVK